MKLDHLMCLCPNCSQEIEIFTEDERNRFFICFFCGKKFYLDNFIDNDFYIVSY